LVSFILCFHAKRGKTSSSGNELGETVQPVTSAGKRGSGDKGGKCASGDKGGKCAIGAKRGKIS